MKAPFKKAVDQKLHPRTNLPVFRPPNMLKRGEAQTLSHSKLAANPRCFFWALPTRIAQLRPSSSVITIQCIAIPTHPLYCGEQTVGAYFSKPRPTFTFIDQLSTSPYFSPFTPNIQVCFNTVGAGRHLHRLSSRRVCRPKKKKNGITEISIEKYKHQLRPSPIPREA
jgi:hypothetical protein